MRTRAAATALVLGVACSSPVPTAATLKPDRPSAAGWYTAPVRVSATVTTPNGLRDVCLDVVVNAPRGVSTSSTDRPCPATHGTRWTMTKRLAAEARYVLQLQATDTRGDPITAPPMMIALDLTPPASTFRSAGPFRGTVSLQGDSADDSSGVKSVVLVLDGPGGERHVTATCACVGGNRRNRPPEAWSYDAVLPAGRWTARVTATDYAGLRETNGPSIGFDVG